MEKERAKRIGQAIRQRRKELKITMKKLGSKIGCSEQAISQYERGERRLNVVSLIMIAKALQCTTDDLASKEDFEQLRGGASIDQNIAFQHEKSIIERNHKPMPFDDDALYYDDPADSIRFYMYFERLNEEGLKRAFDYMEELTQIPRYQRKSNNKSVQ